MSDGLLTEEEVKSYLGLDHVGVEKLIRRRKLTAYRLGGSYVRYRKDEVTALKNGRKFQMPGQLERNWFDKIRDFLNFYSIYILLFLLAVSAAAYLLQS